MKKSKVVVLKTNSTYVIKKNVRPLKLSDIQERPLDNNEVILNENISWHLIYLYLSCKKIFKSLLKNAEWGKLFQNYKNE